MTTDLKTYDLMVIGGGPAGITAATAASSFRKSVALVDNHQKIGGAGMNTGTVPSKTLRETALVRSGLKSRNLYGVDLSLRREVTVADFLGHEEHVKDAFHASITQRLQALKATIYYGTCTFLDAHTIRVSLVRKIGRKIFPPLAGRSSCAVKRSSSPPVPRRFIPIFFLSVTAKFTIPIRS